MFPHTLSVADRVTTLKNIFNDFGIPVMPNSSLDLAIQAEFGRGKRSKITPWLLALRQESDAAKLATCIATELKADSTDKQVIAVANVLQQRLPPLLNIIDIRQTTEKRVKLLSQLLDHFIAKIPVDPQSARMLRMLAAAQQNLLATLQVSAVGQTAESLGIACNLSDVRRFGKILQGLTPALVAIDQPDYPLEQKLNHCAYGLRVLAMELRATKLVACADVLEEVHWLAKVALPKMSEQATVEEGLQRLGISLGNVSTQILHTRAAKLGLTQQEMAQLFYAVTPPVALAPADQELLERTQENQQYAAICGFIAKLSQELRQEELEKISIAGVCLATLRQTYYELKTNNLNSANFSESLGTMLVSAGTISKNPMLMHVGNSVLSGVKTYAGMMGVPGGASIAVPLAVCSVLSKLFIEGSKKPADATEATSSAALDCIIRQILLLQQQMRGEFAALYKEMYAMHHHLVLALDQGFVNLENVVRYNNAQTLGALRDVDHRIQDLQLQINREFSDLYLEYVHDPLEEVAFATRYGSADPSRMLQNKDKLAMWLVYKSRHPKVNGGNLGLEHLSSICSKAQHSDGALALINRYANVHFAQHLPEDLPHIPTWLLAAHAFVTISTAVPANSLLGKEELLLTDIQTVGNRMQDFVRELAANHQLWRSLEQAVQQCATQVKARWSLLKLQIDQAYLQSVSKICLVPEMSSTWLAESAEHSQQLEPFAPVSVDITTMWNVYMKEHIPAEFLVAAAHGLGKIQIKFAVDGRVNTFTDTHIAYGSTPLPDHARDVLFRVDVIYKHGQTDREHLLSSTWLAYDLHDAQQRFEQYYRLKFKYGLRHNRYHWISLDGMANQVEGHGNTVTQKLIDHDRLATVYKAWLSQATPVTNPQILARVKQNPRFMQQQGAMLERNDYAIVQSDQITILRVLLYNELRAEMHKQRVLFAESLQQDTALMAALEKLDVYFAVVAAYMRILNIPFTQLKILKQFNELTQTLQQPEALQLDFLMQFNDLFALPEFVLNPGDQYLSGEFYTKIQAAIARLGLLQTSKTLEKLRLT